MAMTIWPDKPPPKPKKPPISVGEWERTLPREESYKFWHKDSATMRLAENMQKNWKGHA